MWLVLDALTFFLCVPDAQQNGCMNWKRRNRYGVRVASVLSEKVEGI